VIAVQLRATCFGTGIRSGKTDRRRLRVLDAPGLSTANATSTVMRAGIRPARVRGYRQPAFGVPRFACATIAPALPRQALGLTVPGFKVSRSRL
jgi:hypothetical protein